MAFKNALSEIMHSGKNNDWDNKSMYSSRLLLCIYNIPHIIEYICYL